MEKKRTPSVTQQKGKWQMASGKYAIYLLPFALCLLPCRITFADTAAQSYNPPWASELNWARQELWARPTGASAWLENAYTPWWQNKVAHPITDYTASKLPVGAARVDASLDAEFTIHRALPGWTVRTSPTGINNVYTFTPGGTNQDARTARAGQNGFVDLAAHPFESISADIGAELVGNYDYRYYFPVSDEHRLFKDDRVGKIVRGEVKYDTKPFMIRAFEGVPHFGWTAQNDLFQLLPPQYEVEYDRLSSGSLVPRGGEMRSTTPLGTLTVLGGSEIRWGYGSSAFAKYDAPVMANVEQSIVYRNENIPFGMESTDERRWSVSYNASTKYSDRVQLHGGLMYQPFRVGRNYQTDTSANLSDVQTLKKKDALGLTLRTEIHPEHVIDHAGIGYTYLGPAAGNKHEVDLNATRTAWTDWTFSGAYIYRQPIQGPVPTRFEGSLANPGAFLSIPRGPDDPFRVKGDNRKAHIASLTLIFDPTPATPFFKYTPNVLEDWNLNPEEDATWVGAVQYRMTQYLTNTDRRYYWDE